MRAAEGGGEKQAVVPPRPSFAAQGANAAASAMDSSLSVGSSLPVVAQRQNLDQRQLCCEDSLLLFIM